MNSDASLLLFAPPHASASRNAYFTTFQPRRLDAVDHHRAHPILLCHCFVNIIWRCRNFHLLSIAYDFRPRLRSRLTLGGSTFPRKPWAFDAHVSRMGLATHTGILSSVMSTTALAMASALTQCSSTDASLHPAASVSRFSPVTSSALDHSTSELLRTL